MRHFRLADRDVETACGLSVAQLFVLHQLANRPAQSIAELAAGTLTDPSSVSTVVAKLVERALVVRSVSPTDRRRSEHALTRAGKQLLRSAPPVPQTEMIAAICAMPAARRGELVRSLERLVRAIGAETVEPRMLFEDETGARRRPRVRSARGPRR